VAYKMANPPQRSHPSPCPRSPSQASADEEIKIEHDDGNVNSPSEIEQYQSASGEHDFGELLDRTAMQNQQLVDMQRLQLMDKPQNDATNHEGQCSQASK